MKEKWQAVALVVSAASIELTRSEYTNEYNAGHQLRDDAQLRVENQP